ncbi:protoporphyrinogen oxidase [Desemzia sp. FAM 23989]|uniref:protoporphyrinogen oxidase n=1 Tax=Desemzia sp. FAM 23989 TaxID=3259523 RepID=UPI00388390C3
MVKEFKLSAGEDIMERAKKRIAVIGGGITGLTAAYRIKQKIEAENLPFELIILESALRVGGKIYSMKVENQYLDLGAESIDTRYPEAIELVKELGLEDQLIFNEGEKQDLFYYNELHQNPYPTYKGIPINKKDIWKNKMLSFNGKMATFKDRFMQPEELEEDIGVSSFLKRRLGDEIVELMLEPFFSKVYANDIDDMGVRATNEVLFDLEQEYGSIEKALLDHPELQDQSGNYATFAQGLSVLTNKLEEILKPHIQYSKKVVEIKSGVENTYILNINLKEEVRVGAICVATPTTEYSKLFKDKELKKYFSQIKAASVGHIVFSFDPEAIKNYPAGFGILTPRRNDSFVSSIVFLKKKWPTLYSSKEVLLAVNFGRKGEDMIVSLSNKEIEEKILNDLEMMLGITQKPNYRIIKRWPDAIPQFSVDLEKNMKEIVGPLLKEKYPGVLIGGNGLEGYGLSQCIRQGNEIGVELVEAIKERNCISRTNVE